MVSLAVASMLLPVMAYGGNNMYSLGQTVDGYGGGTHATNTQNLAPAPAAPAPALAAAPVPASPCSTTAPPASPCTTQAPPPTTTPCPTTIPVTRTPYPTTTPCPTTSVATTTTPLPTTTEPPTSTSLMNKPWVAAGTAVAATGAAAGGIALLVKGLMDSGKSPCTTVVPYVVQKMAVRAKQIHAPAQSTPPWLLLCIAAFAALSCCCLFAGLRKRVKQNRKTSNTCPAVANASTMMRRRDEPTNNHDADDEPLLP